MSPDTIRIDELLLRLPTLDESRARLIAEDVSARLAGALGRRRMMPIPRRDALSVHIPDNVPAEQLAELIAARILEALR
jgi:hypothetical protein